MSNRPIKHIGVTIEQLRAANQERTKALQTDTTAEIVFLHMRQERRFLRSDVDRFLDAKAVKLESRRRGDKWVAQKPA